MIVCPAIRINTGFAGLCISPERIPVQNKRVNTVTDIILSSAAAMNRLNLSNVQNCMESAFFSPH